LNSQTGTVIIEKLIEKRARKREKGEERERDPTRYEKRDDNER